MSAHARKFISPHVRICLHLDLARTYVSALNVLSYIHTRLDILVSHVPEYCRRINEIIIEYVKKVKEQKTTIIFQFQFILWIVNSIGLNIGLGRESGRECI